MYEAWVVMTKHKTASLYFHAFFSHLLLQFLKLLIIFVDSIIELKVPKGLLKS